jgi:hypothetical protein
LSISQNFDTSTSPPTENSHDSVTEPAPAMCKEIGESEPTLPHENNNENCEDDDNDELIEMPHNDDSFEENKFVVENKI